MQLHKLSELLTHTQLLITYVPIDTEVDFKNLLSSYEGDVCEIKPDATLDPLDEARRAMAVAGSRNALVLVPGRRFDATGTRHGKGAGWYDRLLAAVPTSWVRIGLCFDDQFSSEMLVRESWDEPMDYVVVVEGNSGAPTLYETRARN